MTLQSLPGLAATKADDSRDAAAASHYAEHLLSGLDFRKRPEGAPDHPAVSWIRSGMAAVTGRPRGQPLMAPIGLSAAADGALLALSSLAPGNPLGGMRGAALLGARSRLAGLTRQGETSAGGGCRLLPVADGMIAVSLVRPSDWEFSPAWLETDIGGWEDVGRALAGRPLAGVLEQGRALGLAVATADPEIEPSPAWHRTVMRGGARRPLGETLPLVLDLSGLWAGPLCADLLGRMGARVIKVESRTRPDGARQGSLPFFAALNGGKASVVLDFADPEDLVALRGLIEAADIVIESSRPRALKQLGIDAEAIVARRPGLTWIAISGHGRGDVEANWIGYGDDAAVAAGLSRVMREVHGAWLFCGDAIADPLSGIHAALLAWASWLKGGGVLETLSLREVTAFAMAADGGLTMAERQERTARWQTVADAEADDLYELPVPRGATEAPGASNRAVLGSLAPC